MFEGLVRQLLLGYLGRYIKDIQKEQLKITLWNEEVLLENVELILEAFDYLQLPFALKQGRVGKLSIKIPWKKLGWDPIIIILEDVTICACPRDDKEWGMDAIEKREFAGKKAKLAAAELAKLSRRVCGNQAGKSFISYITAKILDSIQLSIRNVHILYRDMLTASAMAIFGLRFSSLTIMRQNFGYSGGKGRGAQVNKLIEIHGLEFYCNTFQGTLDMMNTDDIAISKCQDNTRAEDNKDMYMLSPLDVLVLLSVNRSGRLDDDSPQYSANVELTNLVMSVNEAQLQQILILCEYLSICHLREMYGRYRPWWSPLEKKLKGWEVLWWHYAQESVMADVRRKLRKTSWKYLGERLNCRRKYVNLYKTKLKSLQQDEGIDADVLKELEEMEKEFDLDDILDYRSAAERQLQEFLMKSSSSTASIGSLTEKSFEDEHLSNKPRGWLNWLSRGMLGAGGTDDSSQFSGVISDDVIKDIYEATKFHPLSAPNGDIASEDEVYLSSIKINIHQLSASLRSTRLGCVIAELVLEEISAECKIRETSPFSIKSNLQRSATIMASVQYVDVFSPSNKKNLLTTKKVIFEENALEIRRPSLKVEFNVSPINSNADFSIKGFLQPLEITFDSELIRTILEFFHELEVFKFQHERILMSLDGIDDVNARLQIKSNYIFSNRKRILWDLHFVNTTLVIPLENAFSEVHKMVVEVGTVSFASKSEICLSKDGNYSLLESTTGANNNLLGFQLHDLYDNFEISINDFKVTALSPPSELIPILEDFSLCISLASCVMPNESIFKALEVYIRLAPLSAHFSSSIYGVIMEFVANLDLLLGAHGTTLDHNNSHKIKLNDVKTSRALWFSITADVESVDVLFDLEDGVENGCSLMLSLQTTEFRSDFKECAEIWTSTKALRIVDYSESSHRVGKSICSSGSESSTDVETSVADFCFQMQYSSYKTSGFVCHNYTLRFNDLDIHCYPVIIRHVAEFIDRLSSYYSSATVKDTGVAECNSPSSKTGIELESFGFSNFSQVGPSESPGIPVDQFPFLSNDNFCSLNALESSLICSMLDLGRVVNHSDKGTKMYSDSPVESAYTRGLLPHIPKCNDIFSIDMSFSITRVHFHDSSCIIGTVSLPSAKSSISIYDDSLDIMCSTKGLSLSSSWWKKSIHEFLWGPLLPNISPVVNMRLKRKCVTSKRSVLQISFSIQKVSCILPPEYLEILIGYFSLPDWNSEINSELNTGAADYKNIPYSTIIDYKFEILDSVLFAPVGDDALQFLKLDIQQLHGSFVKNSDIKIILEDIPSECLVAADKFSDRNHSLNLFGRDLSLSLLSLQDVAVEYSSPDQTDVHHSFTLVAPFSADLWVRIPSHCESFDADCFHPTCIMAVIHDCRVNAEGGHVVLGYEALMDVINRISVIDKELQLYKSDVLQFLQSKGTHEENAEPPMATLTVSLTEIRICARSLSVRLQSLKSASSACELIADAATQFTLSASLRDDRPEHLHISFSSIKIFSLLSSVVLAECTSPLSSSSVLDVTFSMSDHGEDELLVLLPNLNVWLHMFDWVELINLFSSYASKMSKRLTMNKSRKSFTFVPVGNNEDVATDGSNNFWDANTSGHNASRDMGSHDGFPNVKLESVGATIRIPARVSRDAFSMSKEFQAHKGGSANVSHNSSFEDHHSFLAITLQTKSSEIVSNGRDLKLNVNFEKVRGTVELTKGDSVHRWPLFQLSQITVRTAVPDYKTENARLRMDVECDNLDMWLSVHILHFWHCMCFDVPAAGPSQSMLSSFHFDLQLRKVALLLTDWKWSSSGPLVEILVRNLLFDSHFCEIEMTGSVTGDLQVNYNNIDKVLWEPFLEPWKFQLFISRREDKSALLNNKLKTDIHLKSATPLNLNITESLTEVVIRATEMIKDAWGLLGKSVDTESQEFLHFEISRNLESGRYAPYILHNLTSLPLTFYVCQEKGNPDDMDMIPSNVGSMLQPGCSVPIYVDETPEEQLYRYKPSRSSDRLSGKQLICQAHRYIIIQLEGTCKPSTPISMDLVGTRHFEVDFSKSPIKSEIDDIRDMSKSKKKSDSEDRADGLSGFVVPVVFDVSVQRYTKLIRLYSTVVLFNATPVALEVRFDIPLGVSPKILDPIQPGQEFPLPLHLAGAGRMRWRPLGNTYLWSEAYTVSDILSHESRVNFVRLFVCYPSHPTCDPFRCCVSVHDRSLPSVDELKASVSLPVNSMSRQHVEFFNQIFRNSESPRNRSIYQVTLSSPLILKNYLPEAVSVTIENAGSACTSLLSEVESSFFHVDSSHDLIISFDMPRFKPSTLKFPRAETFAETAKFSGTKFSLAETIAFEPRSPSGPLFVTMEKVMDAFSGAREICMSVPYLLYNCTGFPLEVSASVNDMDPHSCIIPSCYNSDEQNLLLGQRDGLGLLSSDQIGRTIPLTDSLTKASSKNYVIMRTCASNFLGKYLDSNYSSSIYVPSSGKQSLDHKESSLVVKESGSISQSTLKPSNRSNTECQKVNAWMYSPDPNAGSSDIMIRLGRSIPDGIMANTSWSSPFSLVPPTGSTSVLLPQLSTNAGDLISVSAAAAPLLARTKIISFQPRYVISNACNKDICYKQKRNDTIFLLGKGEHSHLQWPDTTRDLLVSIRFDEPGWQWSGCFLPEHLGDTLVKMRNYASGTVIMIRVEVQSADVSLGDEDIVGSPHGNSGTNLILLSNDDTGFMPYRIDNFSKERLRVYQQRCETFETMIHPYASCPYAWDEPCHPHRLTIEVPGERIIGSYALDDVKEYSPVYLPATSEKPERTLLVSVHSEGATKVLSITDSSYHIVNEVERLHLPQSKSKKEHAQKHECFIHYNEKISVEIPFLGISLINSYPEELLFACARNMRLDFVQSLDQQKLSLNVSSLQVDNQLQNTPYPVVLSFDMDKKGNPINQNKERDDSMTNTSEDMARNASDNWHEPVFCLALANWRSKDTSLPSFEYITLRVADFHLELEEEIILSLFVFSRNVSSRYESRVLQLMNSTQHMLFSEFASNNSAFAEVQKFLNANDVKSYSANITSSKYHKRSALLPSIIPIGAPWQHIHLLARKQKKIYVEHLDLAPITLTLSFSSSPWMLYNRMLTSGESLIHRGLMALADVEGAKIHLKSLILSHQLASWESIQEILVRHYTRQILHDIYKVFGSAGVIGNPLGFARSMGLGIRDFFSVPVQSVLQSPAGLLTGMAQGTTSLLSNTVYAVSDAATQFSKAAQKGIVALTFDDQSAAKKDKQQQGVSTRSNGVINEFLEGLTGLLQSPIKGAEKHGLPGVISGIALGVTGLVARPAASILEVTGKTAQSIRNRSNLHNPGSLRLRIRLPRPLSRELPLRPYSWEEAIGTSVLREADESSRLRNETLVMCKALKRGGQYVIITDSCILLVSCTELEDLGKPNYQGVPVDLKWVIERRIEMEDVIHADNDHEVVHIVGSCSDTSLRQIHSQQRASGGNRGKWFMKSDSPLPLFQVNLEFVCREEAEDVLRVLLSVIKKGKEQGWGPLYLLHQSNVKLSRKEINYT